MQVRFSPCGHAVCCRRCAAEACCASLTLTLALALSYPIPLPTLTLTLTLTSLAARRRPPQAAARAAAPSARVASPAGSRRTCSYCSNSRRGCSSAAPVAPHRYRSTRRWPRRRLAAAAEDAADAADGACNTSSTPPHCCGPGRGSDLAGLAALLAILTRRHACPMHIYYDNALLWACRNCVYR